LTFDLACPHVSFEDALLKTLQHGAVCSAGPRQFRVPKRKPQTAKSDGLRSTFSSKRGAGTRHETLLTFWAIDGISSKDSAIQIQRDTNGIDPGLGPAKYFFTGTSSTRSGASV
jgi:hypothetical protein